MAITAAQVESNGWVLALTVTGALTSPNTNFGAYVLSPDSAPRVAFSVSSPGFIKSAGSAVAGSTTRNLVATKVLRKVVDPTNPLVKILDETDLGGGTIRVRIALSQEVYATDSVGTLAVLTGWRAGEGAASGLAITNSSTLAAPVPIMRWVLPPYDVATGSFRVSLIVGSVHPVGFEPVAGVKFTATDGTTIKTVWATALATDNSYGDNLRCYSVTIDPTTATALTAGMLRIDAEVYPWVGAMRTTDPASTRSMTNIRTDGFNTSAASPWVIGYDPAGTRYSQMWVYVDQVNGTTTPNATSMVQTTLAGAKAVTAASRAKDISTAVAALRLRARSLPAANGQAISTNSIDGGMIVLATGMHGGTGITAVGTGTTTVEVPPCVIGDPDDSNPRANCIIDTTSGTNLRCTRMRWRNLTVLSGGSSLNTTIAINNLLDGVTIEGKSGSETVATAPIASGAAPAGQINWHMTNTKVWRTGFAIGAATRQVGLVRDCEFARRATGVTFLKNRHIPKTEDGFTASNNQEGMSPVIQSTDLGAFEDLVVAYNDMRSCRWGPWNAGQAASGTLAGISPQTTSHRRHLIINNIFERISTTSGVTPTSDGFFGYGEAQYALMDTVIIEGNTFVGSGFNAFYSDPTPASLADINSQTNITRRIRHANNACDRNASKHDDFSDPNTSTIRTANGVAGLAGYRPACIGAWSVHYGVGMEGHVDCSRKGTISDFIREYAGLRGNQFSSATAPGWTNDRSEAGNDLGGGDYTPVAGSVMLNRITRGNSDRDFANNARLSNGASGALEAAIGPSLVPNGGRSAHTAAATSIGVNFVVFAASTSHGQTAQTGLISVAFALVAAGATLGQTAGMPAVVAAAMLGPASAVSASWAAATAITATEVGTLLAPARADHRWNLAGLILFPDSTSLTGGTLDVPADQRTIVIQ